MILFTSEVVQVQILLLLRRISPNSQELKMRIKFHMYNQKFMENNQHRPKYSNHRQVKKMRKRKLKRIKKRKRTKNNIMFICESLSFVKENISIIYSLIVLVCR